MDGSLDAASLGDAGDPTGDQDDRRERDVLRQGGGTHEGTPPRQGEEA